MKGSNLLGSGDRNNEAYLYFRKNDTTIIKSVADTYMFKNGKIVSNNAQITIYLQNDSILILSADLYLLDGHHRLLSAMLIDPKMKLKALIIDLPIKKLLPLTIAYGDSIGNKRNQWGQADDKRNNTKFKWS